MSKIIVIYGGGFQPFHAGHLSSYLQAKQKFGKLPNVDFYVTASDNTNTRPIPFKEKQWLAKQAGVSEQDFRDIVVKSPLNPVEILSQYDPDNDIFILVRSERDPVGYTKKDGSPGYYQPFVNINKCVPFNSKTGGHGYVFVTKKEEFVVAGQTIYSGTQVRNMYAAADNNLRNQIVHDMYPNSPNELAIRKVLDKYIGATDVDSTVKPKSNQINKLKSKQLAEHITRIRPLIKEASIEQKYKFLKLMKEAYQLNELNLFKKKKVEPEPEVTQEPETSPNDYHSYFAKPKKPEQKVYHSPQEFLDKNKIDVLAMKKNNEDIDEARLHFLDPNARINVYYITPRLQHEGKVQNLAHNIPYKLLEPFVDRLRRKYTLHPEYIVWGYVGEDPKQKYGDPISEDDSEQLSNRIRAVPSETPGQEWDYYYKNQLIEPGTDIHSKIKELHFNQKNPDYQQFKDAFSNPDLSNVKTIPPEKWPENQPSQDRIVPDFSNPYNDDHVTPPAVFKDANGKPIRLKDLVSHDPDIMEDYLDEK